MGRQLFTTQTFMAELSISKLAPRAKKCFCDREKTFPVVVNIRQKERE